MARRGYVYVFNIVGTDYYKIGKTGNVGPRFIGVQVCMPYELANTFSVYVKDPGWLEKTIHGMYADQRARGEWFELGTDDIDSLITFASAFEAEHDPLPVFSRQEPEPFFRDGRGRR